jgi:hypothetical protein
LSLRLRPQSAISQLSSSEPIAKRGVELPPGSGADQRIVDRILEHGVAIMGAAQEGALSEAVIGNS